IVAMVGIDEEEVDPPTPISYRLVTPRPRPVHTSTPHAIHYAVGDNPRHADTQRPGFVGIDKMKLTARRHYAPKLRGWSALGYAQFDNDLCTLCIAHQQHSFSAAMLCGRSAKSQ